MHKSATTTFSVSDVSPATAPLREVPYKEALEALLSAGLLTAAPGQSRPAPATTDVSSLESRSTPSSPPRIERSWTTARFAFHRISSG